VTVQDVLLISRAADFAARQHAGQRRKGKAREPYLNHLAEVASILAEVTGGTDAVLVAAGWLHDTVEDTDAERDDVVREFGEDVAALVVEVTDDKSLPKAERKRLQVVNASRKSARAKLLKIADKISNLRSLMFSPPDHWERERLLEYLTWAEAVVAGCRGLNPKLDVLFDMTLAKARGSV
jgi:(p)ppGpp synthase/HD superfamily hydrolase